MVKRNWTGEWKALWTIYITGAQWGFASSITLVSSGGGIYDYGLTLGPGENVFFNLNATITLFGLSV